MEIKVKLISNTARPVETLYLEHLQARTEGGEIPTAKDLAYQCLYDPELNKQVRATVRDLIHLQLSVSETVHFVLLIENIPIVLREQLVRHRIGHYFGTRLGADIVHGMEGRCSWWSQTSRILDMSKFADEGRYFTPESVAKNPEAKAMWDGFMRMCQETYRDLEKLGVHRDDSRMVLPIAMQHRMAWTTNLAALQHVLNKRTCWVVQLGIWQPLIQGIIAALREVDPIFGEMADPPCVKGGVFCECPVKAENEHRIKGHDTSPPCSLYMFKQYGQTGTEGPTWVAKDDAERAYYREKVAVHEKIWQRNPVTGVSLPVIAQCGSPAVPNE